MGKLTNRQCGDKVDRCEEFVSGNGTLSAECTDTSRMTYGLMPKALAGVIRAIPSNYHVYVVKSYDTPIAFRVRDFHGLDVLLGVHGEDRLIWQGGLIKFAHKYSVTTSRHSGLFSGTYVDVQEGNLVYS